MTYNYKNKEVLLFMYYLKYDYNSYVNEKPGALRIRIEVIKFSNFKNQKETKYTFCDFLHGVALKHTIA